MTTSTKTNTNTSFIFKVTAIHVLTYIICGMIFCVLFNYKELMALDNAVYFFKQDVQSISIGPVIQIIRGFLFGLVLLLFRDSYENKKYGWLRLWLIMVVIGIINTPSTSPGSIEGLIYTQLPLELVIKGMPEILIQTLLFSILVTAPKNKFAIPYKWRKTLITAVIAAIGFSLSGIVLTVVLDKNPLEVGFSDPVAFVVMFVAVVIVGLMTLWYINQRGKMASILYYAVCYLALAVLPTIYNIYVDSELQSYWSLLISALPVLVIAAYLESTKNKHKKQA